MISCLFRKLFLAILATILKCLRRLLQNYYRHTAEISIRNHKDTSVSFDFFFSYLNKKLWRLLPKLIFNKIFNKIGFILINATAKNATMFLNDYEPI